MNDEDLLTRTFERHEALAPDPDAVWAGINRDIARGRRRPTRTLAVAASVAAVVAAAIAVPALVGDPAPRPTSGRSVAAPTSAATTSAEVHRAGIAPLTMPYDLGWLPDGRVSYLARRINVGGESGHPKFDGEYMLSVVTARGSLDVDVQQMPGPLGDHFKCGGSAQITIAGRPANESANASGPCGYEVYFRDAAGGTSYVNVSYPAGNAGAAPELRATGRRIAENVRFPGHHTVQPSFGVGDLPDGLRVLAFDVENGGTSYQVGRPGTDPAYQLASGPIDSAAGRPGREVQGHATRVENSRGYLTLSVLRAVHGHDVSIAGFGRLSTLYRIADGLVLP